MTSYKIGARIGREQAGRGRVGEERRLESGRS